MKLIDILIDFGGKHMKEEYITLDLEIIVFESDDVITESPTTPDVAV